jgi:hypothetical protein
VNHILNITFVLLNRIPDIILTTLKPQLKNVTAQDVASSLYYLHFNTEDDLRILDETHTDLSSDHLSDPIMSSSVHKPLSRKPLPESARPSLDTSQNNSPLKEIHSYAESVLDAAFKPPQIDRRVAQQSIRRRPVGPRLPTAGTRTATDSVPRAEDEASLASQTHGISAKVSSESGRSFEPSNVVPTENNNYKTSQQDQFLITIIRRDPTSGAQWNVGDIAGRPAVDFKTGRGSSSPPKTKKNYFDISVNITAPGYTPFRASHASSQSTEGGALGKRPDGHTSTTDQIQAEQRGASSLSTSFHRQISMEGSGFWARSATQRKRATSDLSVKHSTRSRDENNTSAAEYTENGSNSSHVRQLSDDTDGKGYMFTSLWGGRCKFTTGSGGRSLRCKHILSNNVSTSHAYDSMAIPPPPAPISELRFNLPSSDLFASLLEQGTKRFHHIRNKLSSDESPVLPPRPNHSQYNTAYSNNIGFRPPLPPRSNHSFAGEISGEDEDEIPPNRSHLPYGEDDGRLDLSLGQEKAGGGNRGKRAKLGKLVIHDEGFKMLDLVVAANMGIWWSVWEADFY